MSWAADGQNGNGLQLEKNWANNLFKLIALCLGNLAKTLIIFILSSKIHLTEQFSTECRK